MSSGYFVAPNLILTAAHGLIRGIREVVAGVQAYGPAALQAQEIQDIFVVGDLAVISTGRTWAAGVETVRIAEIDRSSPEPIAAIAIGFPRWKVRSADRSEGDRQFLRDAAQIDGWIQPGSNFREGTYEFLTKGPVETRVRTLSSPWSGISGASVFADSHLVGLIAEHHDTEGIDRLTVIPARQLLVSEGLPDEVRTALLIPQRPDEIVRVRSASQASTQQAPSIVEPRAAVALTHLPKTTSTFVGRQAIISRVVSDRDVRAPGELSHYTISGMPGLGKSALACELGQVLAEQFPDGVRFIDLRGHRNTSSSVDSGDAALALLTAGALSAEFQHRAATIEQSSANRVALWQEWLSGRRMIVVLDNAAAAEQVVPLLPASTRSMAIVTSRSRLEILTAIPLDLQVMDRDESHALLWKSSGRRESDEDPAAVEYVVDICGGLPLALLVVAGKLRQRPRLTVRDLAEILRLHRTKLGALKHKPEPMEVAFDSVYTELSEQSKRTFRVLAGLPVQDFDCWSVAAAMQVSVSEAAHRLDDLVVASLVTETGSARYGFHDLIREFGQTLPGGFGTAEGDAQRRRLYFYLASMSGKATALIGGRTPVLARMAAAQEYGYEEHELPWGSHIPIEPGRALAWFREEAFNLLSATAAAWREGEYASVVNIMASLAEYARRHGPWASALEMHRLAVAAAEAIGEPRLRCQALVHIGMLEQRTGRHTEALHALDDAIETASAVGFRELEALALNHRGTVLRRLRGRLEEAYVSHQAAHAIYVSLGLREEVVNALCYMTVLSFLTSRYDVALETGRKAYSLAATLGYEFGMAYSGSLLGSVTYHRGDLVEALERLKEAEGRYRALHHQHGLAETGQQVAIVRSLIGDLSEAIDGLGEVVKSQQALGNIHGQASAWCQLGIACLRAGDLAKARVSADEALRLNQVLDFPLGVAEASNLMGFVGLHLPRGRPEARRYFLDALSEAERASSRLERARAQLGVALTHEHGTADRAEWLRAAHRTYVEIGSREAEVVSVLLG